MYLFASYILLDIVTNIHSRTRPRYIQFWWAVQAQRNANPFCTLGVSVSLIDSLWIWYSTLFFALCRSCGDGSCPRRIGSCCHGSTQLWALLVGNHPVPHGLACCHHGQRPWRLRHSFHTCCHARGRSVFRQEAATATLVHVRTTPFCFKPTYWQHRQNASNLEWCCDICIALAMRRIMLHSSVLLSHHWVTVCPISAFAEVVSLNCPLNVPRTYYFLHNDKLTWQLLGSGWESIDVWYYNWTHWNRHRGCTLDWVVECVLTGGWEFHWRPSRWWEWVSPCMTR